MLEDKQAAYGVVFGSDLGREVLADIMKHCGVSRNAFSGDPCETAFMLGRQDVGQHIKKVMEHESTRE